MFQLAKPRSAPLVHRQAARVDRQSRHGLHFLVLAADGLIERDYTFVGA